MNTTTILELLLASNHKLTRIAARATGSSVSSAVWSTLSVLNMEGAHRVGSLARAARISQPGMSKVLQNLVDDEWVYRIADVEDSRAWLIDITAKGRLALAGWRHELASAMEPIFDGVPDDDWRVLERATQILSERVDAAEVAS